MTRAREWTPKEHEAWVDRAYFRRNSLIPPVARFWGSRLAPPDGWIFVDLDLLEMFEHQERIWEQLLCEAWENV